MYLHLYICRLSRQEVAYILLQGLICAYTEINPYQLSSSVVKGKKQADRVN